MVLIEEKAGIKLPNFSLEISFKNNKINKRKIIERYNGRLVTIDDKSLHRLLCSGIIKFNKKKVNSYILRGKNFKTEFLFENLERLTIPIIDGDKSLLKEDYFRNIVERYAG